MQASPAHKRHTLLLLLTLSVAPFFINLGSSSLWDSNEAFYAETPREMLEAQDLVNPTFNYQPRFNKPPLCYWVVAASYKLFGVSEWAERLPLALGAMVMMLTAFILGRLAHSTAAGLLAALMLATVPRFVMFSRRIIIDVYIAMFMGLTLMFFALAEKYPEKRRLFLTLMYASVGLGVLTKGPVAAALPALAFLIYLAATRRLKTIRQMLLPWGALVITAIILPWYAAIYAQHGWHYISTFIFQDNLSRYTQPVWGPRRGYFFYLPVIFGDLFPWSLFLFAAVFAWALPSLKSLARRTLRRRQEQGNKAIQPAASGGGICALNPHLKLLLIWVGVIVSFYSLSSNKEDLYISPIYAAATALVGAWVAGFIVKDADEGSPTGGEHRWVNPRWVATALGVLLIFVGATVGYLFGAGASGYELRGAWSVSVLAIMGGLATAALTLLRKRFAAIATIATVFAALNWVFVLWALPDFERYKPVRPLCEVISREASAEARVGYYRVASPSMVFYLRRQIFEYYKPEEIIEAFAAGGEIYCLMNEEDYAGLRDALPPTTRILASRPAFRVKLRTIFQANAESREAEREGPQVLLIANK